MPFLFIFALIWSGMVLMFDGIMLRGAYHQYESRQFPSATGTITHSELKTHHSSKGGTSYSADIEYQFAINGQNFTGDKVRFGITTSGSGSARAIVDSHPVGSPVPIFYNPANPQESLLSPGINGSDFMFTLFLTPFNMVMFGFWVWIGGWLRERIFKPVAGGVKIINDNMTTRIRLPQFPAIGWGIVTIGGLAFISIFIVGFSTNMAPSIPLILSVIGAVYGAGIIIYLRQWRKINSGIDDLIVNESSQTIELPLTFDRKERVTANVADIQCLYVEKVEHRSNKGGISYTYAPTLCLRKTEKEFQKLADWSDKKKADDFTEWLRTKLGANIPATFTAPVSETETENENQIGNEFEGAPQIPAAEIQRPENSRIKVSDNANGREFYFPPARNLGAAVFTTIIFLAFAGGLYEMHIHHFDVFFESIFGLFSGLLFFGTFSFWFKSSRVTIDSTSVRATNGWLLFTRTRQFSTDDVARFATSMGMRSGSKIYSDIKLVRVGADEEFAQNMKKFPDAGQVQDARQVNQLVVRQFRQAAGPSGVTVASGIGNLGEANWLVQEMNNALGRK